jgi:hypothetical protein
MRGDVLLLSQLVNSMSDAAKKLEQAKNNNKIEEFNKIKSFVLDLQKKIGEELEKEFI